ncbi:MAG: hypothetical protein WC748_03390 [Legionellales bacterium]|jgi:hypothetical protein
MSKFFQVLVVLFSALFFSSAFAQTQVDAQAEAQAFLQDLQAKVTLTTQQQDQMKKIMTDSINQREMVISSYQGQSGMMVKKNIRDDLEGVNAKTQTEVQNVLNEEQYKAFLQVQEVRQQKLKDRINSEF